MSLFPPTGQKRYAAILTILLGLSSLMALQASGATPRPPLRQRDFQLQIAERHSLTATSPEAFAAAADALAPAIEQGHRNRTTLYNYGTLLLLATRYPEAEAALAAAECYSGTTWSIRRNLRLARSAGDKQRLRPLGWQRIPLFWHYQLSLPVRLGIVAGSSLLCWLAFALLLTRHKRVARYLLAMAVVAIVLFGSSVLSSLGRSRRPITPVALPAIQADSEEPTP